jgi:hemin uptake protein HemP
MSTPTPTPPPATGRTEAANAPPIDSRLLFGDLKTVQIEHGGQRYTLRITRENKLILTK